MKSALVTGASEGIGRAFAVALAHEGYAVTAVARNEERLRDLEKEISGLRYVVADLTSEEGVATVSKILRENRFELLINNAGMGIFGPFHAMSPEDNRKMLDLNCRALVDLSGAFLAGAQSGDALINVSSGAGFLPLPWSCLYTGTKAFVTAFSEALWFEQRKRGVYVMALCPGGTYSKFHERAGGDKADLVPAMMQTPEQVVAIALKQLKRRRDPVVICGVQKPAIVLSRFFPRKWVVWFASKATEGASSVRPSAK